MEKSSTATNSTLLTNQQQAEKNRELKMWLRDVPIPAFDSTSLSHFAYFCSYFDNFFDVLASGAAANCTASNSRSIDLISSSSFASSHRA